MGSSGANDGIGAVGREHRVHLAHDPAELLEPGEERVGGGRQLLQAERPPVDGVGDEPLQETERRLHALAFVRVPAGQLGGVVELVLGEEQEHVELGVHAGTDVPVGLHEQVVDDDDGVRRVDTERARHRRRRRGDRTDARRR